MAKAQLRLLPGCQGSDLRRPDPKPELLPLRQKPSQGSRTGRLLALQSLCE